MEFDNSFDVPLAPDQAWMVLMDIPRIAPCMPGAELTEIVDPQNYAGKISVRLLAPERTLPTAPHSVRPVRAAALAARPQAHSRAGREDCRRIDR